jgi:alpha-tubulin suppressor-like RCC1 family protein
VRVCVGSRTDWLIGLATTSAALIACNQILGVEDVNLAPPKTHPNVTVDGGGNGDDDDHNPIQPNPDGAPNTIADVGALALGFNHGCARIPGGTVKCWGDNGAGQLGDSIPFEQPDRPQEVHAPQAVPNVSKVIDITSGLSHTCVLVQGGTVSCWGLNSFGQLGDGTQNRSSKPVAVVGLTDATAVAAGESFTCAIRQDKTVSCWGANYAGQLGDGLKADSRLSVAPVNGLSGVVSLTAARNHACAVLENGDVMCWGGNDTGQLGIGSTAESLAPAKLLALANMVQVAAAAEFSCARETSGKVYCWGKNDFGQLGNGTPNLDPNPSPILVPSVGDASFLWTGFEHACVVRKTGEVACWGHDDNGQLGTGDPPDGSIPTPAPVAGLSSSAVRVWTGGFHSCAIVGDGHGFCWGSNTLGELGNGTTDPAPKAVQMTNFP